MTLQRLNDVAVNKKRPNETIADILTADENKKLEELRERERTIPKIGTEVKSVPQYRAGQWIGSQTFKLIPVPAVPYLELASILHIGNFTHFGCGTF